MRIALVNPPPRGELEKHWAEYPVLGLAYVASSLRAHGHDVLLFDGKLAGLTWEEIVAGVAGARPDLVGITCMTVEYPLAAKIATAIRAHSAVPIAMGGAHVNAVRATVLDECPAADFACIGEGEHLAVELAAALAAGGDLARIPGLAHRVDGHVIRNPAREYHDDYDSLPFPAWELFHVGAQIPLLTHRGCPFECNFCGHNSGFKPRYRSPENVLAEIEYIVETFRPLNIRIEDETFGLNLPRTRRILELVVERGLEKKVTFSAQTRVDRVDGDFIRLLKRCNFRWLEVGVESGSPDVLKRMGKGITLDQVERAIGHAKAERLKIWTKFILGHPHETRHDMRLTARFIARLNPDRLSVSVMTPFPGTPIFDMAVRGEGGYRMLSDDWGAFDKYSSGALELKDIPLSQLKLLQLYCYLNLYLRNGRVVDLVKMTGQHMPLVLEMVRGVVASSRSHPASGATGLMRPRPLDLPTAGVASPDTTLVQLQRRGAAPAMLTESKPVRSWAAPGP
jgi:radical SAM superfamily enzyme YgiQ (UPF0313 family)